MASSIHYLIINANTAQEAMDAVLSDVVEWGTEDNYKHIVGAIDTNGVKYAPETPVYYWNSADLEETNLELIHSKIAGILDPFADIANHASTKAEILSLLSHITNGIRDGKADWDVMKEFTFSQGARIQRLGQRFFDTIQALEDMGIKDPASFSIWEHTFRSWQLDEYGVTDLRGSKEFGENDYCVLLWVHS